MRRITIIQGDHLVITEPEVMLATLLGSCVAVCLHDALARVGGMNHFLLAEPDGGAPRGDTLMRYGSHAIEVLINGMMRHGAMRERIKAHVYGGANLYSGFGSIGTDNARFAIDYLERERITVGQCDIGGNTARRVEFLPYDGRVRVLRADAAPPPPQRPTAPVGNDVELF